MTIQIGAPRDVFLQDGEVGVLRIIAREAEGIFPFLVTDSMLRPFEFGALGEEIEAEDISAKTRFSGTWMGVTLEDLFYYDDADYLLHIFLETYPTMKVWPSWISGYLQSDYHDLLPAAEQKPYGFLWSPVEFISIPKVHLDFYFENPYGSETLNPFVKFWYNAYHIKPLMDAELISLILTRRYKPEPKWWTIYGRKPWSYNFKDNMKITRPIPLTASRDEIESVLAEWRRVGVWE
jgi:hypothetical protein